ncbi:portal protein [Lysobacter capsici]|uniref:portal protein n=2 Tax=Lysobacter capsici TaxID=435897 RepID=UPI00287BAE4F|nr:portal protein [Lysobacter capsici]WND79391.1 portal protein [Lysobacter capsici]WND84587.1 portal protein [Lysobacter capsici]
MATRKETDGIDEMRRNHERAEECWGKKFDMARDDIKFVAVPGHQWDEKLKARRKNRPTYEFPKLPMHTKQVINEMRQARPQGKVRGAEESDRGLAEIMQGLCRNIESVSNAEQAYDIAYEAAVQGGYGVWRICTDYASDDDFELDIRIKPIRNPFSAKCDPAAVEIDRRDSNFWFIEELIPEAQFEREHPKADKASFDSDERCADWREKGQVRRAEYWYKKPMDRELWAVESQSGTSTIFPDEYPEFTEQDFEAAGLKIVKRRKVKSHKVYMRLTNGHEWLSEPYEFPSKFIPIVITWGNIQSIDGDDYFCGMVRFSKDQQRLHNVHRTALVEAVAKAPKAPFITKPSWIKGYETMWNNANAEDYPVLYLSDSAPENAIPKRTEQAQVPAALIQLAGMDNDDMKAATGQYDASLGARSNETSGIAINSRKQQGATATFNYIDNLTYAIRYTYEILIDMIPRVYDTPRTVRILGEDGGSKWKELYQQVEDPETHEMITLNDISKGKYDVTVTVGPAYATQRMEAVEAFSQLAGQIGSSFPEIGPLLAYQVVKNLDLPGSEEVDQALRKALVAQGLMPPKEGEEAPPPQQPNPKDVASAEKDAAQAKLNDAKAIGQQLQNQAQGAQMAMLAGGPPQYPPDPMEEPEFIQEPPQGGFFSPEEGEQFAG